MVNTESGAEASVLQGHLPTLDGWRAIAALAVMGFHSVPETVGWEHALNFGGHGVNIFFGISGLLITTRLLNELEKRGTISLLGFYARRALRILPAASLYILVLTVLSGVALLPRRTGAVETASCIFFFRNYLPNAQATSGFYTSHFWSLSVEEHFYLLWPALLLALSLRRARLVTPVLALAVTVWRFADQRLGMFEAFLPGTNSWMRTDHVADGLLWGSAWAVWLRGERTRVMATRLLKGPGFVLVLIALVLDVVFVPPLAATWEAFLIPAMLWATVSNASGWVGRLLEISILKWLGRISYGLYLWQQLFFTGREGLDNTIHRFPANLLAAITCATVSYYLVERPILLAGYQRLGDER